MTALSPLKAPTSHVFRAEESRPALPAWPLYLMIGAYPIWWALGAAAFSSPLIALVMIGFLVRHRSVRLIPGLLPWFTLLVWIAASAVMLKDGLQAIGYVQRLADLVAIAVALLYYVNARERLSARSVIKTLVLLWVSVVVLGVLATQFPNVVLTSPVSYLLPDVVKANHLVRDMVYPPLAEVQQPYGAPAPFNRPAAPFPYANGWGVAYAVLTPVVLAYLSMRPRRSIRYLLVALLVISLWPAVATSNRGMFLAVAISIVYVTVRLALRGRVLPAVGLVAAGVTAGAILTATGAVAGILGRQQYSNSTGTRADIYTQTFVATLDSPILGWGTPLEDVSIGYALGTQGQAWMLMYSYGFVGLGLFLYFLVGAVLRTWSAPSTAQLWLHSVPFTAIPVMWYYGFSVMQMLTIALVSVVLLRLRYGGEKLE